MPLDLTPFDFTPTESHVYQVLVTKGPGTGYAVARAAGLARANAYAALEGLVTKGAARADEGKPRRYRPEPPAVLLGRIIERQGKAIDTLAVALEAITLPATPTLNELTSIRAVTQLLTLEIARAKVDVLLCLPAEAYPPLGPALRRAGGMGVALLLGSDGVVEHATAAVRSLDLTGRWPGRPLLAAIDGRLGLIGSMDGDRVTAHWGTAPAQVAAAATTLRGLLA